MTCLFILVAVILLSFLLLYSSVTITCNNIRSGAKMSLNNLSASIYADTYRSQREVNIEEYMKTVYSSPSYLRKMEQAVTEELEKKVPLHTDQYQVKNIRLAFTSHDERIEYVFQCEVEFYISMFGNQYPTIRQQVELTGYHNTKF